MEQGYYDYLLMKKDLKNDILCNRYLNYVKEENGIGYSKVHYTMYHENKELNVFYYPEYNKIEVAINIPYFLNGHNYSISLKQEKHVVEYISSVLGTNMFKADADQFEYSALFEIPFNFKKIQYSHIRIKGMVTTSFEHGKYFSNRNVQHRIYDAQRNIKNKLTKQEREELAETTDYNEDKYYLKIENRYKRPEIALKSRGILVENLFQEEFNQLCKNDLMEKYQSITKMGGVDITSKKQLSSEGLYMIALKRLEEISGINTEQYLKETIKSFSHILSPDDRKARIKQVNKNSQKIQTTKSEFDVSELLHHSLFN